MFAITSGKGFQMTFENGVILSIQFGPGNYCDNRDKEWESPRKTDRYKSNNCEVAIILPNGDFYTDDNFYQVEGWQTVNDVVKWINFCQNMVVKSSNIDDKDDEVIHDNTDDMDDTLTLT